MERLTVKTSTIFVSVGDETRVYRSMGEVPAGLRRKLEKSTTGMNAATILIADKRGREEIVRAVRGLPTGLQDRVPEDCARPGPPAVLEFTTGTRCSNWSCPALLASSSGSLLRPDRRPAGRVNPTRQATYGRCSAICWRRPMVRWRNSPRWNPRNST